MPVDLARAHGHTVTRCNYLADATFDGDLASATSDREFESHGWLISELEMKMEAKMRYSTGATKK